MRFNDKQQHLIHLQGENIKETGRFIYLGGVVSKDGLKNWVDKARHAWNHLELQGSVTP